MTEYKGLEVEKVRITATVTFEAYASKVTPEGDPLSAHRIACDLADAIEYRAPHLSDSEDDDALIALVGGGSGKAVEVAVHTIAILGDDFTLEDVKSAVEGTEAWISW